MNVIRLPLVFSSKRSITFLALTGMNFNVFVFTSFTFSDFSSVASSNAERDCRYVQYVVLHS
jgi:hypothetical protein